MTRTKELFTWSSDGCFGIKGTMVQAIGCIEMVARHTFSIGEIITDNSVGPDESCSKTSHL